MTTEDKIAEIKFKVDHKRLHPQEQYEAFYVLFNEIERLRALTIGNRPIGG